MEELSMEELTIEELYFEIGKLLTTHPEYSNYSITIPCECGYSFATPMKINRKCFHVKEEQEDIRILSDDDSEEETYEEMGYILL